MPSPVSASTLPDPRHAARRQRERDRLANFASLPDDAHLRVREVAALCACSVATVWRWAADDHMEFPAGERIGPKITCWRVGDLRTWLNKQRRVAA